MAVEIELFACRDDNYGVLIRDVKTGTVAAIDAPEETAIETALKRRGWRLDTILITHRHHDHIEAIEPLKARHGAKVIAPVLAKVEVSQADRYVDEGDTIDLGAAQAQVWATPGHCADHLSYYFADEDILFSGDTLFAMGCGRVFDSTAAQLYAALGRMAALPPHTRVYCGHEYTLSNAKFCAHIEPENAAIAARLAKIEALRAKGDFTVPTTIGEELATNVFMRAKDAAEFAARREGKNNFRG